MSRRNFFQFLIKMILGKTKKAEPDLKLWTSRPWGPTTWGARYKKNKSGYTLAKLRPWQRKKSNKHFFFNFPDLVHRPTAPTVAGKNRC